MHRPSQERGFHRALNRDWSQFCLLVAKYTNMNVDLKKWFTFISSSKEQRRNIYATSWWRHLLRYITSIVFGSRAQVFLLVIANFPFFELWLSRIAFNKGTDGGASVRCRLFSVKLDARFRRDNYSGGFRLAVELDLGQLKVNGRSFRSDKTKTTS